MRTLALRSRWLLSVLLLAGAALFVIGVTVERNSGDTHNEGVTESVEGGEEAEHNEAAEAGEHDSEAQPDEHGEDERVLGLDIESVPLVASAALASVVLAIGVWLRQDRWLLWLVAGFALGFAVLDVAELAHQIDKNRTGLAVIAAAVAAIHLAAASVATLQATNEQNC